MRILIVDDELSNRRTLEVLLKEKDTASGQLQMVL